MNAFKRGKKGYQSIYVPTKAGGLVQRSTGTAAPAVVRAMRKMVRELRDRSKASGNWSILDAVQSRRAKLSRVHLYWSSNQLDALEAELSAHNLAASLDGWLAWIRANRRAGIRTPDVYWQQVTTLVGPGSTFLATTLTKQRVMTWLTSREQATSGTRRKYFYALKSFIRYCLDTGALDRDPLAGMKAPKKDPPRERWVTADVDEAIVTDSILKYRAFFALVKGTGCDVGAALRAQVGDVNVFRGTVNVRGTKTDHRRVFAATIEPWALPYIRPLVTAKQQDGAHALLFPGMTRNAPSKHHAYVCARLKVEGYTLKDARHSVGVRMRLAGKSFEEIAAQLGTSVYQAVTVYAKFKPEDVVKEEAK